MKKFLYVLATCLSVCATTSCGNKNNTDNISGKAGEVIVVAPETVWNSEVGALLKDSLMRECPCLPQREPMYTLVHVPNSNFTRMFKIHRNIIYLNVSGEVTDCRFLVKKNAWAHPQMVFYVDAPDKQTAYDLLQANMHTIFAFLEEIERERVIGNTENFQEPSLREKVRKFAGATMIFPKGYSLKKETDDFLWISNETRYVQQGFFICRTRATRMPGELGPEALLSLRNRTLKAMVPGGRKDSYMTTASFLTPQYSRIGHDSIQIACMRGLWELHNDYMGGPFVSHSFYNRDSTEIISLEAYVYAPKHDKRIYLRQVESLLYTFKWESF